MAELTDTVTLYSSSLLSKWGFSDGDLLNDRLSDLEERLGIEGIAPHRVLIQVVREFLLPALDQAVELEEVITLHNPVRARTVNGVEIDAYDGSYPDDYLTPESVEVPWSEIERIATKDLTWVR